MAGRVSVTTAMIVTRFSKTHPQFGEEGEQVHEGFAILLIFPQNVCGTQSCAVCTPREHGPSGVDGGEDVGDVLVDQICASELKWLQRLQFGQHFGVRVAA